MNSPADEVKNKLDIVDVIGGYIKLKKAGRDYKALCPFHNEKTPSFFVSPAKQIWHCFGCNLGGDMFSFIMQIEGLEFIDALRILANKAGVQLKKQDPKISSQRSKLFDICEEATDFFEKNLEKNKQVLNYLKNRGIALETIKEFRIGYALDSWNALYDNLTQLGYSDSNIEKAGLIIKKQKYYDRFRKRILFPINDISGQVIGFTGRIFEGDEKTAKYVNSPESMIFNKSSILYGLDKAKIDIRQKDSCILVEGQVDVIMSHQTELKNSVATSGTALTKDHLRIIKRYTNNILLAFDTDTAGETATKRSIALAQKSDFNVGVIILPKGKDPADIISQDPKTWKQAVENSKPVMEFYFDNVFSKYNTDKIEDKRKITQELLVPIKRIANHIERAHWIQDLASRLNIEEKLLSQALAKITSREQGIEDDYFSKSSVELKKSRIENLEQNLLGLALKYPRHLDVFIDNLNPQDFITPVNRKIFEYLKDKKPKKIDAEKIQNKILPDKPYYINHIIFQVEHYELEDKHILKEINFCISELKKHYIKQKASKLSLDIKKAEKEGNKNKVDKLKKQFNNLFKK